MLAHNHGSATQKLFHHSHARALGHLSHLLRPRDSKAAMRERVQQPRLRYTPALSLRAGQEGVTKLLLDRRMNKKQCAHHSQNPFGPWKERASNARTHRDPPLPRRCSRILVRRIYRLCHHVRIPPGNTRLMATPNPIP